MNLWESVCAEQDRLKKLLRMPRTHVVRGIWSCRDPQVQNLPKNFVVDQYPYLDYTKLAIPKKLANIRGRTNIPSHLLDDTPFFSIEMLTDAQKQSMQILKGRDYTLDLHRNAGNTIMSLGTDLWEKKDLNNYFDNIRALMTKEEAELLNIDSVHVDTVTEYQPTWSAGCREQFHARRAGRNTAMKQKLEERKLKETDPEALKLIESMLDVLNTRVLNGRRFADEDIENARIRILSETLRVPDEMMKEKDDELTRRYPIPYMMFGESWADFHRRMGTPLTPEQEKAWEERPRPTNTYTNLRMIVVPKKPEKNLKPRSKRKSLLRNAAKQKRNARKNNRG